MVMADSKTTKILIFIVAIGYFIDVFYKLIIQRIL